MELSRTQLEAIGIEAPENLPATASVLTVVCDGLMLQWHADPTATPNADETLAALAAIGAIAATRLNRPIIPVRVLRARI